MPTSNNNRKRKTPKARVPRQLAPVPEFTVPNADEFTPQVWGSNPGTMELTPVTVPSGQRALVRRPGMEGLIGAGVLMEVDHLTALVDRKHVKRIKSGQGFTDEINTASLMKDPGELDKIMKIVDKTIPYIVVRPEVRLHFRELEDDTLQALSAEEREEQRNAGFSGVYTDQIDLNDRMFLFTFGVGGSSDLERFRGESEKAVGGVDDEPDVQDETV